MAVPEDNDPIHRHAYEMIIRGINTLEDLRRIMLEAWDEAREENRLKKPGKPKEMRATEQRVTSLEQDARQPHLDMMAGRPVDTKTREHTEGAATAVQAMHGDSCSATRAEPGPRTNSTSFGMMAEPPDLPCREDVLVEDGAAPPKSCLPSLEMRTTTATGSLLPTGEISTATKTTFNQSPLRLSTEETTVDVPVYRPPVYRFALFTGVLFRATPSPRFTGGMPVYRGGSFFHARGAPPATAHSHTRCCTQHNTTRWVLRAAANTCLHTMPCAAGELCQLSDSTTTPEFSCCGPCGGCLHRICGDPDDDEEVNRIC